MKNYIIFNLFQSQCLKNSQMIWKKGSDEPQVISNQDNNGSQLIQEPHNGQTL